MLNNITPVQESDATKAYNSNAASYLIIKISKKAIQINKSLFVLSFPKGGQGASKTKLFLYLFW